MVLFDVSNVARKVDGELKRIFIEECETCCNPIQIDYTTLEAEIASFETNYLKK